MHNQSTSPKPKTGPKGHDAVIKALQDNRKEATIITTAGEAFTGIICGRDKFTITLLSGGVLRRVFYKHAIEQFFGEEPTPRAAS